MAQRVTGKVKWFDAKKGYGFISVMNQNKDVFVHFTDILQDGYKSLEENQAVEFEIVPCQRGEKAQGVKVIS